MEFLFLSAVEAFPAGLLLFCAIWYFTEKTKVSAIVGLIYWFVVWIIVMRYGSIADVPEKYLPITGTISGSTLLAFPFFLFKVCRNTYRMLNSKG